jgi:nicotinate-nucleotide pyrophosphorylase (carboxylating)
MATEDAKEVLGWLVKAALDEDRADRDATTTAVIQGERGTAEIRAEAAGIVAGGEALETVLLTASPSLTIVIHRQDGARVEPGDIVATIEGDIAPILRAERTALNFLMHLSGVATATARLVEQLEGTGTTLLDTRKTIPLLRGLQKSAVRAGGGVNHRHSLEDYLLIKSNHIRAVGSLSEAVRRVRRHHPERYLEVEVRNLDELDEALGLPVDRIMLDNFGAEESAEARRRTHGRIPLEASGGITSETVRKFALAGMDFISVGSLTHSAPALPFSLRIVDVERTPPSDEKGA